MREDPRGWTFPVLLALGAVVALVAFPLAHAIEGPPTITQHVLDCTRYITILGHGTPDCVDLVNR